MIREVVLDTETTGVDARKGDRVVEIGCVELINHCTTGKTFHTYLNPQRPVSEGAFGVHGLSDAFLADKPLFAAVSEPFLAFIAGARLIIHNAPFDVAFLDHELSRLEQPRRRVEDACTVVDTLAMARHKHPGQKNNLDALCRRYDVDNSQRELHGALLDAEILADVYLMMTGGQTVLFVADEVETSSGGSDTFVVVRLPADRPRLRIIVATGSELDRHGAMLDEIDRRARQGSVWRSEALALTD